MVSYLEDIITEIIQIKAPREKTEKENEQSLSGLWDNIKQSNIPGQTIKFATLLQ